jgi:hypothetical protein
MADGPAAGLPAGQNEREETIMSTVYEPARAGETREVPSPVLDTLYQSLDLARGTMPPAAYLDARNVLDDLAQSLFTVRADADQEN